MTPTARTLKHLRDTGWTCQVVEHWNAFARVRVDLFGVIDIVAMKGTSLLGVQATSGTNVSKRVAKARDEPRLEQWLATGAKFEVWGWRKRKVKRGGKAFKYEPHIVVFDITQLETGG